MERFEFNQKVNHPRNIDTDYTPMILGNMAFIKAVKQSKKIEKVRIALCRDQDQVAVHDTIIFSEDANQENANIIYIDRLVKTLLWLKGGYKIYIAGPKYIANYLQRTYQTTGTRAFDYDFMSKIYEQPFEVIHVTFDDVPKANENSKPLGRHLDGYRIGFDAGGSDRKVSAVAHGKAIYSEEVVWHPKLQTDPMYHRQGIMDSISRAASKLPQVDAIGVSSAGIYIDNKVMAASLFMKVAPDDFNQHIKHIFTDIAKEMGDVPIEVANDGDVTALAGAMSLDHNKVLGIAMGTSEAAGYVDHLGHITGWLNELAFVPVDYALTAMQDEWSLDYGCGVKYFSQDAVIKLASKVGISLDEKLSPAEKLKIVQQLVEQKDDRALQIFDTIGIYLGYTLAYYHTFYDIDYCLILGRVTSGEGGQRILKYASEVLENEFNELYQKMKVVLPDEENRRVGQSIAAASLPQLKG